jgi:hypothetical protein
MSLQVELTKTEAAREAGAAPEGMDVNVSGKKDNDHLKDRKGRPRNADPTFPRPEPKTGEGNESSVTCLYSGTCAT